MSPVKRAKGEPRRYYNSYGYVRLRWRDKTEVYEHRWVMEQALGRPLRDDEQVHHVNHIRDDNRLENLQVVSAAEHREHHRKHDPAEMERLYRSGMSLPQVGCAVGCDSSVVLRALRKRGVPTRSITEANTKHVDLDRVREWHAAGVPQDRIASLLGISSWAVSQRFKQMGLVAARTGRPTEADRARVRRALESL